MFEYKVNELINDLVEYCHNRYEFFIEEDDIKMYIKTEEIPHIKEEYGEIIIEFKDKEELGKKILDIRNTIREKKKKLKEIKEYIEKIKE